MSADQKLAARLRIARERAGLSQGQVARLMNVHRPTISQIEAGDRRVQAEELKVFSKHYRVPIGWLMGEDGGDDLHEAKVLLAARELTGLKTDDLDRVINLLASLRRSDANGKERKR